ncbi:Cinnamyl-alcohol dehydrogenase Flavonol reductase/cinnamoyl-CoA reductase [Fusarium equiseti]|uniref:Cinnamyl-alcohol dehydrogenase Flavonol reductase/cinnamoyl-CoA reductase n=1 Tax=Fusarium equiseti TaxID=61235 RepID=A0ABQ8RMY8_FUSEQ|nr:Cinnamyl-alcohol dehydrogenase Flavonol reductase/cinnamoyl-CoA reductase [Fusarium equiseti]
MSKLYVGNLSWNTTDDTLRDTFSQHGEVVDSIIMRDRETGRARGFGFVTFANEEQANNAVTALNEQELDGRRIRVNVANARPAGGNGFGGGRGGYGGGRGGYGGGDRSYGGGDRSYGGGDRGGY